MNSKLVAKARLGFYAILITTLSACSHVSPMKALGLGATANEETANIEAHWVNLSIAEANKLAEEKILAFKDSNRNLFTGWIEVYCDKNLASDSKKKQVAQFLELLAKDEELNEAQDDAVQECVAAHRLWNSSSVKTGDITSAKSAMLALRDLKKNKKTIAKSDARVATALRECLGFIRRSKSNSTEVAEAYILLAEAAEYLDDPMLSPSETFFLKKVVRNYPQSEFAESAFDQLFERVHFGYTGSSGDKTPEAIQEMLARYKEQAFKKNQ